MGNVTDVAECIRKYKVGKCSLSDLQYRIACIFPDLFVLCEKNIVNVDESLEEVYKWFEKGDNKGE